MSEYEKLIEKLGKSYAENTLSYANVLTEEPNGYVEAKEHLEKRGVDIDKFCSEPESSNMLLLFCSQTSKASQNIPSR